MTDFRLLAVRPQADGSTRLRFSAVLEPAEWVAADTAVLDGRAQCEPPFQLLGEIEGARETPPLGRVRYTDVPSFPTRHEFDAVARFRPVNAESVLAAFKRALDHV